MQTLQNRVVRADDIINYTITITNTGNVTLTDLAVVDALTDGAGNDLVMTSDPTNQWTIASLAPGAVQTYTPYYTIGSAAVLTGSISNVVTVTGDTPNGTDDITAISDDPDDTTSDQDPTVVDTDLFASITVTKQDKLIDDGDGESGVGDLIEYTVTVTNTGEVPVTDIELVDTMAAGDGTSLYLTSPGDHSSTDDTPWELVTLEVGESVALTGLYVIEEAAFNTGSVVNAIVATGDSPSGTDDVTASSGDTVTSLSQSASIIVTKTASPDSGVFVVGDVITYTIKVKNTGNSDLNTLTIVDTLKDLGDQGLVLTTDPVFTNSTDANTTFTSDPNTSVPTLLVGEEVTFTATFAVTQAAIDAGGVKNTVSVTATADDATNTSVADTTDSPVITTITQSPVITVTKTAAVDHVTGTDSETTTGDTIVYTITIANTGNVTLTGIDITDTMTDGAGQSLTLTSPSTFSTYTLAPGETEDIQATYTIEQSAADTGSISNTVSVDGTAPDGTEVTDDLDTPVVVSTTLDPSIEVTKTSTITHSDADVSVGVGDTINYTITVENTGNTTLTGVTVSDTILDSAGVSLTLTTGPTYGGTGTFDGTLDVGESATYSATFVITQQAVNAGGVSNTASVTSKDPEGNDVTDSTDSATEDLIPRTAEMSVVKTATVDDNGDEKNGVGDVIQYTVTVTNTGNVTLTDVDLSDELRLGSSTANVEDNTGNDSPAGVDLWTQDRTLLPGESATYVAWYIIDDTAASSGKVINTAIATADTPLSGADATLSVTSNEAEVDIAPIPSILVEKETTTVSSGANSVLDVGETILYTITLTNDGNTTLTGVSITDVVNDLGGTAFTAPTNTISYTGSSLDGSDPPADSFSNTLAASEFVTFEALLTIDQAMVDAGGVVNTVSAVGYSGTDQLTSSASTEETLIAASPALTVSKTATVDHVGSADEDNRVVREDDRIYYTITITNTGNVTLTDLAVVDALTDGAGNDLVMTSDPTNQWTIASLAPGAVQTYTPYYTIGSAAVLTGSISNVVTVTGDTPNGTDDITAISDDPNDTTSDQDPTVVDTDLFASITVTKQDQLIDDGDGESGVGDLIEYTVTVTNTGEVPVTDIELVDTMAAGDGTSLYLTSPGSHSATDDTPWELVTLEVGESVTLTGFYVIEEAAFNTGSVVNSIVATGDSPSGTDDVTASSGDTVTSLSQSASIIVTKTASPDSGVFVVGDVITYTIKVKNTGNSDLNTLTIVDTLKDLGDQGLVLTTDPVFTKLNRCKHHLHV
jgi:uncharacterized repeat protein (TIGR01451 family)